MKMVVVIGHQKVGEIPERQKETDSLSQYEHGADRDLRRDPGPGCGGGVGDPEVLCCPGGTEKGVGQGAHGTDLVCLVSSSELKQSSNARSQLKTIVESSVSGG